MAWVVGLQLASGVVRPALPVSAQPWRGLFACNWHRRLSDPLCGHGVGFRSAAGAVQLSVRPWRGCSPANWHRRCPTCTATSARPWRGLLACNWHRGCPTCSATLFAGVVRRALQLSARPWRGFDCRSPIPSEAVKKGIYRVHQIDGVRGGIRLIRPYGHGLRLKNWVSFTVLLGTIGITSAPVWLYYPATRQVRLPHGACRFCRDGNMWFSWNDPGSN